MNKFFKKIFGQNEKTSSTSGFDTKEHEIINNFLNLDANNKVRKIMILGDTGESKYLPLLKYCISNKFDKDVKFAALKRIHLFEKTEVQNFLIELQKENFTKNLEPYFSMALSRVGIITIEEFNNRINGS